MFVSHGTIFPSDSVTLVSSKLLLTLLSNVWQKNLLVNQSCQKFRHMWLQDSELKLAQCLLPILLIQQKPFVEFAIMQSQRNIVSLKGITGSKSTQIRPKNFLHAP